MKHIGLIMSAGKGLRVGGDTPKQYMDLCGKPVIYYALKAMQDSFIDEIILVVGEGDGEFVKKDIVEKYSFGKVSHIVAGGKERSDSVYNGLLCVSSPENSYVYIQDAARPMLSLELLKAAKEDVECFGTSVVGVPSKDTIKVVNEEGFVVTTPNRQYLWNIQTPQTFVCEDLLDCYKAFFACEGASVTDDASVMEQFGSLPVHITKGFYENIKITTKEDFSVAENFLQKNEKSC